MGLLVALMGGAGVATEGAGQTGWVPAPEASPPLRGAWQLALELEHTWGDEEFGLEIPELNSVFLRVERRLVQPGWRWLSLGGEAGVLTSSGEQRRLLDPQTYDGDETGLAAAMVLRAYVWETERFGLYVEALPGVVHFTDRMFDTGTRLNGLLRAGVGARYTLDERWSVEAGYRRLHISNGLGAVPENPAYDGNSAVFSVTCRW